MTGCKSEVYGPRTIIMVPRQWSIATTMLARVAGEWRSLNHTAPGKIPDGRATGASSGKPELLIPLGSSHE